MKKFFLFVLAAVCAICVGAAVACSGNDGEYYSLVFRQTNGVTYVCDIPTTGVEVRAGTEVRFTITLSEEAQGYPVVYRNDEEMTADKDGYYSFTLDKNTVIKVLGIDAPGGEYNRIFYNNAPGATVKFTTQNGDEMLQNGMLVRNGTQVDFEVSLSADYFVEPKDQPNDAPLVKANDTVLVSTGRTEAGWTYSFVMNGRTEITIEHIKKNITVTYVNGDTRVKYYDAGGDQIDADTELPFKTGDEVNFKVEISVYYKQDEPYEVQANNDILTIGDDGLYHYTFKDDTRISVNNLVIAPSFTERPEDCGSGTERTPFLLSEPIDLYQMAGIINGTQNVGDAWRHGYYRLEKDIDLKGEQLFIIGTTQNDLAYFAGHFDGNGHKISNFYIVDNFVDQETFQPMVASSVGMFGTVTPRSGSDKPEIKNLTLENYQITASAASQNYRLSVGSFVGMGYGVDIINCKAVGGTITVTGGQQAAYVGGIIGQQVSAYSDTGAFAIESRVIGCGSNAKIRIPGSSANLVYATGGITGLLGAGERSVSAYVLNSYFTGNISGGLRAGGVVGYASDFTSVINSYSNGVVRAQSPFSVTGMSETLYDAYAAGVVAELGYDSIVSGCFSTSSVSADTAGQNATKVAKPVYAILGGTEDGVNKQYGFNKAIAYNNLPEKNEGKIQVSEDSISNIMETLGWHADEWETVNGYPIPKNIPSRDITIKFVADGEFGTVNDHKSTGYKSLAEWGKINGNNNIPEYLQGEGSYRSYGYYFDAEHKNKVPLGYVFTNVTTTLYIASADYNEVAGKYYLGNNPQVGAYIELNTDGTMFYRNGAVSQETTYFYNKAENEIVLLNTVISELTEQDLGNDAGILSEYFSVYYNFGATLENNALSIVGGYVSELTRSTTDATQINATGNTITLFPQTNPLRGLKQISEEMKYGEYYSEDKNTVYGFNGNGNGYRTVKGGDSPVTTYFTYNYTGNNITITYDPENTETATIENNVIATIKDTSVKPYDGFTGVWEAAYGISEKYEFDGMGKWNPNVEDNTGDYTIEGGTLTATGSASFTATINKDGFLEVKKDEKTVTYYREGSFKGEWYFSRKANNTNSISVSLVLSGLTEAGYGTAVATLSSGEVYELDYEKTTTTDNKPGVMLQNKEILYGSLVYDDTTGLLSGDFTGFAARFTAYDTLMGSWIADDETLYSLSFNGNGFYDLSADNNSGYNAVKPKVQVVEKAADGKLVTKTADYRIYRTATNGYKANEGFIKYKSGNDTIEYKLTYDPLADTVSLQKKTGEAYDSNSITVQHRDEWYGVELKDQNGNVLVFDGRGRLKDGGKLTINNKNGTLKDDGIYKITEQGIKITDTDEYNDSPDVAVVIKKGEKQIGESGTHNVYYIEGKETIFYKNLPFVGDWLIGTVRGELTISEVYADDTATGSYKINEGNVDVQNANFTYHQDGNYLEFTYGNSGKTYYINALSVGSDYRLSFGPDNTFSSANNYTCVVDDAEHKDKYYSNTYYVYEKDSEDNSKDKDLGMLVFDGLGKSTGTVTYYGLTGESAIDYSKVNRRHTYTIAEYGRGERTYDYPRIFDGFYEYLLIPISRDANFDGDVMYYLHDGASENRKYFAVVYPDELYGLTVSDGNGTNYTFDGVGGVTAYSVTGDNVVLYKYTVKNINTDTYIHDLIFTVINKDGTTGDSYNVQLDQSSDVDSAMWRVIMGDKITGQA